MSVGVGWGLAAVVSVMLGAGCGGGGGGDEGAADASAPDATVELADAGTPDAKPNYCTLLEPNYPDLGAFTGNAVIQPAVETEPNGLQYISFEIPINTDAKPDVLFIELWEDTTPFIPDYKTGTFSLIEDNGDIIACGACVFIAADREAGQPLEFHMAVEGSITIDSIDKTPGTGKVTGSLSNVRLREITVDQQGQHLVDMGCETNIGSATFDVSVQAAQ
jgi:hypothetical protein